MTVFEKDADRYRTRRANVGTFNDQSFLAEKPAEGLRIFCLGGSSSYGYPWGAEAAFTEILGEAVDASHPEMRVEAVNASGVSYAMHRLNIVADELLRYDPDIFVVYSGHNEFIEPAFFEALKRRNQVRTRLEYALSYSRVYSMMRKVFGHVSEKKSFATDQFGAIVQRDETRVFSPEEKQVIVAEFRWRLERLVRRAQASGVKVVLATVPANVHEWLPEASTGAESLSASDRQQWSAAFRTGKIAKNAGEFATAASHLERAASRAPHHAETHFLLAQSYEQLNQWDDARAAYQQACDADATPVRRVSGINNAIREVAHERGALLVDMDSIFEQQSEHGLVGFHLIEDYVHPTREGHEIIAWQIWDAMQRAGWFGSEATAQREVFDTVIAERRRRPTTDSAMWLFNQGVVLKNQGHIEEAIEKMRQAVARAPNYPDAILNLGVLLSQTGQHAEAVEFLQRMIEIDADRAEAHLVLGNALAGQHRFDEAMTHYRNALRIRPEYAEAHYSWGSTLAKSGRLEEALAHFRDAVRIKPDHAKAQNNLGITLKNLGRPREALVQFQKALSFQPDFADAHYNQGNTLINLGRLDEAVAAFRAGLRIKPEHAEAHCNIGYALHGLGRPEEAVTYYEQALRFKPDYVEAHNNFANALASLGRLDEAGEHYQETLRLNPEYAGAHYNWGVALANHGRLEDAARCFQNALRVEPDYTRARKSLAKIQSLLIQKQGAAEP